MTDKQPEALIRADELAAIGAESSLARAMAVHTIRLLYKENEALRAALAQPEQEPVAWVYNGNLHLFDPSDWADGTVTPLYNFPPQREWQGLTIEERTDIRRRIQEYTPMDDHKYGEAVQFFTEEALKEKNT